MSYLKEIFYPGDMQSAMDICITPDPQKPNKFNEETHFLIKFLNSKGMLHKRPKVLDFGCGVGRISKDLVDLGCKVVGMDFSIPMLMAAINYVDNKNFTPLINTPTLPFAIKPEFELVICSFVLQHTEDPVKEIKFINSVMKDDATLVLVNEPYRLVPVGMDEERFVKWEDDKIDIVQEVSVEFDLIGSYDYYNRTDKCLSLWKKK
jgi:SAM-dependent methyltransferase